MIEATIQKKSVFMGLMYNDGGKARKQSVNVSIMMMMRKNNKKLRKT